MVVPYQNERKKIPDHAIVATRKADPKIESASF